ncbi:MAG: hypothetical protein U1B79_00745 [Candidatus Pacearchaeota archaeon]|nr:hypothetical protein [Nanoarchaeota archaeon]MDZ4226620.1 hypothetical protein [Candidatus Pacearchaeota archaeon]
MRNKNGFIQISFAWLFAIIIGAIILFFAIYASVKLINIEEGVSTAETGKEISVLLNPLETGFGEERTTPLTIPVESRINNRCESFADFGEQEISISQKKGGEWTDTGVGSVTYNKYIFSNKSVQGKNFYLFSKPFEFPFKISDLIFLTSAEETYCFVDAPEEIQEELTSLSQANLFTENCPSDSKKVCFGSDSNCDIIVKENEKSVEKDDGELVYYETDALMYAAVFADKEIYECQVQRLMKRLGILALIYNDKENILSGRGCPAEVNLLGLADSASSLRDSSDLIVVKAAADDVENENDGADCKLW